MSVKRKTTAAADAAGSSFVEGTTKSGIKYRVDKRIVDDTRFLHYAVGMKDKDRLVAAKAMFDMYGMLFGGSDGLMAFENEIALHHDGICTQQILMSELNEILGALKAKN